MKKKKKKKKKKKLNIFTIFLQTNFYPKKKMASVALWTHVVKYCSKRFLEDCWNTFLWIYLLIMTKKYWLSCVFFPTSQRWHSNFFATKGVALGLAVTCQPYRCLHTGSCQFSSLGGVPVGKRKNKEIGIRRVREFFHQEKWTEVLFSLSKNIAQMKTN